MRSRTSAVLLLLGVAAFPTIAADTTTIDPAAIPESLYVTVSPDGHLTCEGKRVRYWGIHRPLAAGKPAEPLAPPQPAA